MKHKSYMDIKVASPATINGFEVGDHIVIQTKIDGANAAIRYDPETDSIVAQSRKNILDTHNTLRGFYEFTQLLDKDDIKEICRDDWIVYGEWLCLSGDTVIRKTSAGKNSNYMTLREMYNFKYKNSRGEDEGFKRDYPMILHYLSKNNNQSSKAKMYDDLNIKKDSLALRTSIEKGYVIYNSQTDICSLTEIGIKTYWQLRFEKSWWGRNGFPDIFSLDIEQDKIISNKILDIVYTGEKEVYKVITRKGYEIKTTLEHPFLTPQGFKSLKYLKPYDCVAVTDLTNRRGHRRLGKGSREILKAQNEYKKEIGHCEICGRTTCLALHHKDENYLNNDISNWQVLCVDCHNKIHSKSTKFKGFEYDYEFDYITDIEYIGIEDCYDIAMTGNENVANFVADGFIVHNCKHTVQYPKEAYNKFYVYDTYDTKFGEWLPQKLVENIAIALNLPYIKTWYDGEFISWEHCKSFLPKSVYGEVEQEGIVVKNMTKLNSLDNHEPFYVKIVNTRFKEKMDRKEKKEQSPEELAENERENGKTATIVTPARVEKLIHKCVDEGIIPEAWSAEDMKTIARNVPKMVVEDCLKEEPEIVATIDNFGKRANSLTMKLVKNILAAKEI